MKNEISCVVKMPKTERMFRTGQNSSMRGKKCRAKNAVQKIDIDSLRRSTYAENGDYWVQNSVIGSGENHPE